MSSQFEDDLRSELRRKIEAEEGPYLRHEAVAGNIDYYLTNIADRLVDAFWKTR